MTLTSAQIFKDAFDRAFKAFSIHGRGWCQDHFSKTEKDDFQMCLSYALTLDGMAEIHTFNKVFSKVAGREIDMLNFNDHSETTQTDVLRMLHKMRAFTKTYPALCAYWLKNYRKYASYITQELEELEKQAKQAKQEYKI